uniref:Uncharacterized protein n=1 Tax=Fibrocapsa japonica TaxID=94617 RepID=A0A7S2V9M5_9STRA
MSEMNEEQRKQRDWEILRGNLDVMDQQQRDMIGEMASMAAPKEVTAVTGILSKQTSPKTGEGLSQESVGVSSHEQLLSDKEEEADGAPIIEVDEYSPELWQLDEDLQIMQQHISAQFRATWVEAIAAFLDGDWVRAKDMFLQANSMLPGTDPAAQYLVSQIDANGGRAPPDWQGFRDLS